MVTSQLLQFISKEFARGVTLGPDDKLLNGIVDSTGIFVLVAYLEQTFEVRCPDDLLTVENFGTAASIARLVEKLKNPGQPQA